MKIEEDDVVGFVTKKKGEVKVGLVSKIYESEDESSDEEEEEERLKPGELLIETYPKGKEVKLTHDKVVLLDRTLQVGDTVCREGDEKTGVVVNFRAFADVVIIPGAHHVIRRVDLTRLRFIEVFDDNSTSSYVLYRGWFGSVGDVKQKIWIRTKQGFRGSISSDDAMEEFRETQRVPIEGSAFDNNIWYPGQEVQGSSVFFAKVAWVQQYRPPQKLIRNAEKGNGHRIKVTVTKVELESVRVHWHGMVPMPGSNDDVQKPPPNIVEGEECQKLVELDNFVLQTAQIGDRMCGIVSSSDSFVPISEWSVLRGEQVQSKLRQDGKPTASSLDPGNLPAAIVQADVENSPRDQINAVNHHSKEAEFSDCESDLEVEKTQGSSEEDNFCSADENPTGPSNRSVAVGPGKSDMHPSHHSGVTVKAKPKGKMKGARRRLVEKTKQRDKRKASVPAVPNRPPVGSEIFAEILQQETFVDVVWKDGVLEKGVPSAQLCFYSEILDEHIFQAGEYVESPKESERKENSYGFVCSVDEERVATVLWLSYENGKAPVLLSKEEVSELDLEIHKHFRFRPGTCVLNQGNSRRSNEGEGDGGDLERRNIGQVLGPELETGRVRIRWFDRKDTLEWPHNITEAFTAGDEDSDWSDKMSTDNSWSDVSDEEYSLDSDSDENEEDAILMEPDYIYGDPKVVLGGATTTMQESLNILLGNPKPQAAASWSDKENVNGRKLVFGLIPDFVRGALKFSKQQREDLAAKHESIRVVIAEAKKCVHAALKEFNESFPPKSKAFCAKIESLCQLDIPAEYWDLAPKSKSLTETEKEFLQSPCCPRPLPTHIDDFRKTWLKQFVQELKAGATPSHWLTALDSCLYLLIKLLLCLLERTASEEEREPTVPSIPYPVHMDVTQADSESSKGTPTSRISTESSQKRDECGNEGAVKSSKSDEASENISEVEKMEMDDPSKFSLLANVSHSHHFWSERSGEPIQQNKTFLKAVRQELKLLQTSLPPGIQVRGYEDRMDLFSCMISGPDDTPYEGGLFFFDVRLPSDYPLSPPLLHYRSFSSEQMNPNLYQEGKVCVSLLGTWSGKGSEVWNPGSNLLQVLISIQGLILNAEPYYNEAGYESRREEPEFQEKSRRYNEIAVIRNMESIIRIHADPPAEFLESIRSHLAASIPRVKNRVEEWMEGKGESGFPLLPVSKGFKLSANKFVVKLSQLIS